MNEKDFNVNNSNKLLVGISILFCAVIFIIRGTVAFFTQVATKSIIDIVATDQVTLDYQDNDYYTLGDLIPIDEQHLETAYNNKCKDEKGYNVCSIYQFTISNTGNVVQDIVINLHPTANTFHNLKFNLYDITNNELKLEKQKLEFKNYEDFLLINDLTLNISNNKSNTYELVFYIENDKDNDQSHLDAGQSFAANISVNSVTTGTYLIEGITEENKCWETELIEGTTNEYKLTKFYGIDNEPTIKDEEGNDIENTNYGEIKKSCENVYVTKTGEYYSVTIPSTYGGKKITTLGNQLFFAFNMETGELNKYHKINNIVINEGIKIIEGGIKEVDGDFEVEGAAFGLIGFDVENEDYLFELNVLLPNTLQEIGSGAFLQSAIKNLKLPSNLKRIGLQAFLTTNITTNDENPLVIPESVVYIGKDAFSQTNIEKVVFDGSLTDVNDNNKLIIELHVFSNTYLNYNKASFPLELPARIVSIGSEAFVYGDIKFVRYHGSKDMLNSFSDNAFLNQSSYIRTAEEYNFEEAKTYETN